MLKLNHKNLDVWKISIKLVKDLYELTESFPKTEISELRIKFAGHRFQFLQTLQREHQEIPQLKGKDFI